MFGEKLFNFTRVALHLCYCGCIDRFYSELFDSLDFHAPEELSLGKLEKPWENVGFVKRNFRPYNSGERERYGGAVAVVVEGGGGGGGGGRGGLKLIM